MRKQVPFLAILLFLLVALQWPLISQDPLLFYDDPIVVQNLRNITIGSYLSDFRELIRAGKIFDVQPIRDLSYLLDYQLKEWGIGSFHFTNTLIWFFASALFLIILLTLEVSVITSRAFCMLFAFHPSLGNSLFWASGRKHLLSTMFTLLATYSLLKFLRTQKNKWAGTSVFSYALACFSQPINVAWPAFFLLQVKEKDEYFWRRKNFILIIMSIALVALLCLVLNYLYYLNIYPVVSGSSKFEGNVEGHFSYQLIVLGRSFFQSLFPIRPIPTPYYPGSVFGIIGLVAFIVFLFWSLRLSRSNLSWLALAISPIAIVTLQITNILGSDSYLGITVASVLIILAKNIPFRGRVYVTILFSVAALFAIKFYSYSRAWLSDRALFTYAFHNESTPFNLRVLALINMEERNYTEAVSQARTLIEWDPYGPYVDKAHAMIIQRAPLSSEKKISLYKEGLRFCHSCPWTSANLAFEYSRLGKSREAFETLGQLGPGHFLSLGRETAYLAGEFYGYCLKARLDCEVVRDFTSQLQRQAGELWDEKLFTSGKEAATRNSEALRN